MISEAAHAECVRLLELLTNKRVQESWSWVFMTPVAIPGYADVIKKPMDLGTVKKNLGSKPSRCRFKSHEKFARDVRLVFSNALVYNKADQDVKGSVFDAAQHLLRVFETAYAKAIETVLRADDEAAIRRKEQDKARAHEYSRDQSKEGSAESGGGGAGAEAATSEPGNHHSDEHRHRHRHRLHGDGDGDDDVGSGKHKKDKSKKEKSKKEKKSKKSKKKSKEKEKDGERGKEKKHQHHSSKSSLRESGVSTVPVENASDSSFREKQTPAAPPPAPSSYSNTMMAGSSSTKMTSSSSSPSSSSSSSSVAVQPRMSASAAVASSTAAGVKMSDEETTACLAVLMKLIKYKEGSFTPAAPFLQPVDLNHFPDYRVKVPNRMHLYGVQRKLRSGGYFTKDAFAHDVRLIFANCLVYNSDVVVSKVMRSHAVTLMKLFEAQFAKIGGSWPGIPERWKCHQIMDELLGHRTDGQETAQWFKYPIETYFDSPEQIPYGYYSKVKVPMDLGTVSSRLHLGEYKRAKEFLDGLQLVFDNCIKYWKSEPYGQAYCDSADALTKILHTRAAVLFKTSSAGSSQAEDKRSSSSFSASKSATSVATAAPAAKPSSSSGDREKTKKKVPKASSRDAVSTGGFAHKDVCMTILKQLRMHKMKGYRGIEILTAGPFLHAVDTTKYPDYLTIVSEPMDFAKIERKLKSDRYVGVSEFSADVHLIFSNCHKYNSDPVEGADIRAMASNLRDYFVELYNAKLGHLDGTMNKHVPDSKPAATIATSHPIKAPQLAVEISQPPKERAHVRVESSVDPATQKAKAAIASTDGARLTATADSGSEISATAKVSKAHSTASVPAKKAASVSTSSAVAAASRSESKSAIGHQGVAEPLAVTPHAVLSDSIDPAKELRRKERKEKKDKKEKKKKDKKEKKKKDKKEKRHDRHDKKHDKKDAVSMSATSGTQHLPREPSETGRAKDTNAAAVIPPSIAPPPQAPAPAAPSRVGSKMARMDAPASSSSSINKKSSKKSKKSDLKSWESSCERVLNRLSKIEQVAKLHFDQPLMEIFPQLASEYSRLIAEPMDLRTLREQLLRHELTQEEFVRKGRLIFENAVKFNAADDPASTHVREMSVHLLWYFDSLCVELHLAPQSVQGSTRAQIRQQRAEIVTNVPMEIKARECQKLLRVLNSQKYDKSCWPFRKPVSVLFPTLPPEYFNVIQTPMDLATISEKLSSLEYKVHGDFIRDVRLTFENALLYNRADKDREGWSVYSAAVQMLAVTEDLLGDLTLEVSEKIRRRELLRKERERLGDKKDGHHRHHHHHHKSGSRHHDAARKRVDDGSKKPVKASKTEEDAVIKIARPPSDAPARPPLAPSTSASAAAVPPTANSESVVSGIVPTDSSATRIKLQLVNRPNMERMNKSERKAEEKRRKRARREEEIARSEKRRRTAVAATDDALREAETRSRRRLQKLEMAEAMRAREERERRAKDEAEQRALAEKRKFDAASWSGVLVPAARQSAASFWSRKRVKLQVPAPFRSMVTA